MNRAPAIPRMILLGCAALAAVAAPQVGNAADVPASITGQQAWKGEFDEIAGQLGRLKTTPRDRRDRLAAEALDPQAPANHP